ncbi:unnamed protein product [Trichogramma brassicae]|uniref:Uncharacterized protein n=1 Tax=Trichogramma brassicae TaxID=86971 RepID=A0A6H5HUF0_9HYME|nr:unnamed protein product [Trichogramma brassicae]
MKYSVDHIRRLSSDYVTWAYSTQRGSTHPIRPYDVARVYATERGISALICYLADTSSSSGFLRLWSALCQENAGLFLMLKLYGGGEKKRGMDQLVKIRLRSSAPRSRNWLLHRETELRGAAAHLSSRGAPNDHRLTISSDSLTCTYAIVFEPIRDFRPQDLWNRLLQCRSTQLNFSTEIPGPSCPNTIVALFWLRLPRLMPDSLCTKSSENEYARIILRYGFDHLREPRRRTLSANGQYASGQLTDELAGYGAGTFFFSFPIVNKKNNKKKKKLTDRQKGLPFGAARQRLASWEARNALPKKKQFFFQRNSISTAAAAAAAAAAIAATASAA